MAAEVVGIAVDQAASVAEARAAPVADKVDHRDQAVHRLVQAGHHPGPADQAPIADRGRGLARAPVGVRATVLAELLRFRFTSS